jgi:hypothetical protein
MIINLLAIMSGLATILVLLAGYLELSRFIGEKLYELTVLRDKKQAKADRLMGPAKFFKSQTTLSHKESHI